MAEVPPEKRKPILEALLFVSPDPLSLKQIRNVIEGITDAEIGALVDELSLEYDQRQSGLQVVRVAEGLQMLTRLECSPWLRKLESVKVSNKLSQAALETLAIIAYKQPVIKAEVDAIRGVSSDGTIKTLLDRKLVKILGRKEMPGRPLLYGTTPEFLQYFGLNTISELPTLRDIEEMDGQEPEHPSFDEIRELEAHGDNVSETQLTLPEIVDEEGETEIPEVSTEPESPEDGSSPVMADDVSSEGPPAPPGAEEQPTRPPAE